MNKWLYLLIGVVVGGGIGVLCSKKYYQKLAFDEITDIREMYRKKTAAKELIDKNSELKKKLLDEKNDSKTKETGKTGSKKEELNRYSEIRKPYSGDDFSEYHNIFSNPPSPFDIDNGADDGDPYELVVDHEGPSEGYSEPYEISEDQFASEKLFYDKVMIEYYDDDVAVLEDSDEIVESIEDLIGPNILRTKPEYKNEEFYVRNDNRSTDYGIRFTGTDYVPKEGFD